MQESQPGTAGSTPASPFDDAEQFDLLGSPQGEPQFEGEVLHPETGLPVRMYDARTFDLVRQVQYSRNEVREIGADGEVARVHRSETALRWIYPSELELLLRLAGYSRWEIARGFDGAPLTGATEPVIVTARA